MVTKTYCDHCGNVCHSPDVYCFGPRQDSGVQYVQAHYQNIQAVQNMQQYPYGPLGALGVTAPYPNLSSLRYVDLCKTCVGVWMKRVENLTKASDVQPS